MHPGITLQWLSKTIVAPDHLIAKYSSKEQIRLASQQTADADLVRWLQLRAKELRAGGHVIATLARTVPADEASSDWRGWDMVNQAWRHLMSTGCITPAECEGTCIPMHFRTLEECVRLIEGQLSGVFDIVHASAGSNTFYDSSNPPSDEQMGELCVKIMMSTMGPIFRRVLSGRSAADQENVMRVFHEDLKQQIAATKFKPNMDFILLDLRRK